ncbi:MAG: N-acetylmuramoyl-L-alanine amidase family protein [Planctomycetota bacterium]
MAVLHPEIVPQPSGSRYTNLHNLARVLDAQEILDEDTGVHHLHRGDRHVAVVGGSRWALIGSEVRRLGREVVVRYGRAYVSRYDGSYIERYLKGPAGESPRPVEPLEPGRLGLVCVDPGHGGKDPGAVSPWGLAEKGVVLSASEMLVEELRKLGFRTTMTRSTDVFIELNDRPAIARRREAEVFVSIHANASGKRSVSGMELFYWDGRLGGIATAQDRRESRKLATCIRDACVREGLSVRSKRGAAYRVLRYATMPAVLVELGFLTNRSEERRLRTSAYRRKLARAIAKGIYAYRTP